MAVAKILIVDDLVENLLLLEFALKPFGLEIIKAMDAKEAEEACLQDEFLMVIMDVHMPGKNGIDAARDIRKEELNRLTPIVFLTADTVTADLPKAGYQIGAVDFLYKPLDTAQLRAKVSVFLDLYQERMKVVELMRALEQSQAQMIAQEKYQAIASLTAGLSHNLNNKLFVVSGFASSLLDAVTDDQKVALEKILNSVKACTTLLEQMQVFTGVNQLDGQDEFLGFGVVVDNLLVVLGAACDDRLVFRSEMSESVAKQRIDAVAVREMLMPIVMNSIEACSEPDQSYQVQIEVSIEADHFICLVSDNGPGIPELIQDKVFDLFFSGEGMASKKGLGLPQVKGLVERLNGKISVLGNEPAGTVVRLVIPVSELVQ
jgi:signal transduction histidine kinase